MKLFSTIILSVLIFSACQPKNAPVKEVIKPRVSEENITYSSDSVKMDGFVAYDANSTEKRPVILIIHEWWGLNDYTKNRARQLAALGYLTIAVDFFGNGQRADNPEKAGQLAGQFYKDPVLAKKRFDAALEKIKAHPMADTTRIAAIGYCFGGGMALNMARLGENLKGVVSFHGSLIGTPADKNLLKAQILVCHGEADEFVSAADVTLFKRQMDSIGAVYTFKSYKDATHAFSNPEATATGKKFNLPIAYNAQADTASWQDMNTFFGIIFK